MQPVTSCQGNRQSLAPIATFLVCATFSAVWCWSAAFRVGATGDEPIYFELGMSNWRRLTHRELLHVGTMPLPAEVQFFPVHLAERFGADPASDFAGWLPIARMGTILFWWLLLWATYRIGSYYGRGTWAGCLAMILVSCEPVLLGHASLATTDIPATACLLALHAAGRCPINE